METIEFDGCADCLHFVANGDIPEDRPDYLKQFELWTEGLEVWCGDFDGDENFSWSQCECCGSRLGGNRYPLVGIARGTE